VSFLLGHVSYSIAFIVRGQELMPILGGMVLLIPIGIKVFFWLRSSAPEEMIKAILAYIIVITTMATFAIGAVSAGAPWFLIPGVLAFYCSDLAVARDRFVSAGFINRAWGLPLYYLGQILIALSAGG